MFPQMIFSEHAAGRVSLCDVTKGRGGTLQVGDGTPIQVFISRSLFARRMNRKRELFQIPPDMSPAETGNQAASWNGTGAHYGVFGQMYSALVTTGVVGTTR